MHSKEQLNAPIEFYNRYSGVMETESIYGESFLRWAYGNPLGQLTVALAVKRLWFSRWYGWRMDQPGSRKLDSEQTRKLCPYPKRPEFRGGNPDRAASFECR